MGKSPINSALLKSYPKNIFCLEALWDHNVEQKMSVYPTLELLSKVRGIKFIHLTSNTRSELEYNLDLLHRKTSFQILYLAFHGAPNQIVLGNTSLSLTDLASLLGRRFKDLTLHFGSCGTINLQDGALREFLEVSGVRLLSGYTRTVEWIESSAMDLLYFSALQEYKNVRYLNRYLHNSYPDLIGATGFKTFTL